MHIAWQFNQISHTLKHFTVSGSHQNMCDWSVSSGSSTIVTMFHFSLWQSVLFSRFSTISFLKKGLKPNYSSLCSKCKWAGPHFRFCKSKKQLITCDNWYIYRKWLQYCWIIFMEHWNKRRKTFDCIWIFAQMIFNYFLNDCWKDFCLHCVFSNCMCTFF